MRPLFRWPVMLAFVGSVVAVDGWLFAAHELARGFEQMLRDPVNLLIVFGLSMLSAAFHDAGTRPAAAMAAPAPA